MKRLALILVLLAVPAQARTLAQVRNAADAINPYWTNTLLPAQEAFFDEHGIYGQCLQSSNIPNTTTADTIVQEIVGDAVDAVPSNGTFGKSCVDILGASIQTSKPFILRIDVAGDPKGGPLEFRACVYARHDGTVYERCKAWVRAGTGPAVVFSDQAWRVFPLGP